jgi:hypothetical protein
MRNSSKNGGYEYNNDGDVMNELDMKEIHELHYINESKGLISYVLTHNNRWRRRWK